MTMSNKNWRSRRELEEFVEAEAQEYLDEDDEDFDEFSSSSEQEAAVEGEHRRPERTFAIPINFQQLLDADHKDRRPKNRDVNVKAAEAPNLGNSATSNEQVETRDAVALVQTRDADLNRLAAEPQTSLIRSGSFSDARSILPSKSLVKLAPASRNSFTQVRPTFGGNRVSSNAVPSLSCIQGLLDPGAIGAVVGPSLRASLIVTASTAEDKHAAMIVAWSVSPQASTYTSRCYELRVIPIAGCGENIEASWATAHDLESQIMTCVDDGLLNGVPSSSSHYQRYLELSSFVVSQEEHWSQLLGRVVSESTKDPQRHISDSFHKLGISCGTSLDLYELFVRFQDQERLRNGKPSDDNNEAVTDQVVEPNLCLVCFDQISVEDDPMGVSMVSPCGHRTCPSCWRDYLKSAADNGQGHVLCPAYKCSTNSGLLDAAHLLFFRHTDDCDGEQRQNQVSEDAVLYERLVRFEMERFATCQLKARPCPSPHCSRFLTSQAQDIKQGWSLLKCQCGISHCANCPPSAGPSHPGIDCKTYQKLRNGMDSGKLDSELENVKWVVKFSRRCPNCQFAIEKNGGCNHVRCQQCNHYFCWECSGPGNLCGPFQCYNKKDFKEEVPEEDEGLFRLLSQYRKLRQTEDRLKQLHVTITRYLNGNEDCNLLCLELSAQQVLLWLYSFTSVNLVDTNLKAETVAKMHSVTCQLELVVHALTLRKFDNEHTIAQNPMFSQNKPQLKKGKLASPDSIETTQKKYQSKRKQQSLAHRQQEKPVDLIETLMADYELKILCGASPGEFERMAQEAIKAGIKKLWKMSVQPASEDRRPHNRRRIRRAEDHSDGLNHRMKRSNDPWKIGLRRNPPSVSGEDDTRRRWRRDRARLTQLREHAMTSAT